MTVTLAELFIAALIVVFLIVLVRLLTRRSREDAKIMLRAERYSPRRSPAAAGRAGLSAAIRRMIEPESDAAGAPPGPPLTRMIRLARELTPGVRRLVKEGRKPEAVKLVRERTGMDEETAQQIVDRLG